jgi:hypothetical protein
MMRNSLCLQIQAYYVVVYNKGVHAFYESENKVIIKLQKVKEFFLKSSEETPPFVKESLQKVSSVASLPYVELNTT